MYPPKKHLKYPPMGSQKFSVVEGTQGYIKWGWWCRAVEFRAKRCNEGRKRAVGHHKAWGTCCHRNELQNVGI